MSTPNRSLLYMLTFLLIVMILLLVYIPASWAYQYQTNRLELTLEDEVLEVLDGDTFQLPAHDIRIRLSGVDAPEKRQVCAKLGGETWDCAGEATTELKAVLRSGKLVCFETGPMSYGRKVMRCAVDNQDIGYHLVRGGWAWHWPQYTKGGYKVQLTVAQQLAYKQRLGIWQQPFPVEPWVWRRQDRK